MKIQVYGAIGNPGSRWYDPRVAQSVTLSGRCIVKHMQSKINEIITGDYNHLGIACIYGDTDSVDSASIIETSVGKRTIEDLFLNGSLFWNDGDKEYSVNDQIKLIGYDHSSKTTDWTTYNYVYRHKVSKKKYRVNTSDGKSVIVTADHSIMVVTDDGRLVSKKPTELLVGDKIISL